MMAARAAVARVFPELSGLLSRAGGKCSGCGNSSTARAVLMFMAEYGKGRNLKPLAGALPADFLKAVSDG